MKHISKRFHVTPRHDLGTCYNCFSIEINRIHDTLELDRQKREAFAREALGLFEYRLSSAIAIQIKVDSCERKGRQTLNSTSSGREKWKISCLDELQY